MKVRELHSEAMRLAEDAVVARRLGRKTAAKLFEQAFEFELKAAAGVTPDKEPTFSILHRSAASLALDCGFHREAEKLIARALSHDPPDEIADELRELLDQVYFNRSLDLRGLVLQREEFEMSLSGELARHTYAQSEEFVRRMSDVRTLLFRTAERKAQIPFREIGSVTRSIRDEMDIYVAPPRLGVGRFAVKFRVASPKPQMEMWPSKLPGKIVSDLFDCMGMIEGGKDSKLKKHIADEAYFHNFVALARQIAPDGKGVKRVSFVATQGQKEQQVTLSRPSSTIRISGPKRTSVSLEDANIILRGRLLVANNRDLSAQGYIQLVTGSNEERRRITVLPGMMADIVRPLWEENVTVECQRRGAKLYLVSIHKSENSDEQVVLAE